MLFVCYPKCTTCKKAKAFLDSKELSYDERKYIRNVHDKSNTFTVDGVNADLRPH